MCNLAVKLIVVFDLASNPLELTPGFEDICLIKLTPLFGCMASYPTFGLIFIIRFIKMLERGLFEFVPDMTLSRSQSLSHPQGLGIGWYCLCLGVLCKQGVVVKEALSSCSIR